MHRSTHTHMYAHAYGNIMEHTDVSYAWYFNTLLSQVTFPSNVPSVQIPDCSIASYVLEHSRSPYISIFIHLFICIDVFIYIYIFTEENN